MLLTLIKDSNSSQSNILHFSVNCQDENNKGSAFWVQSVWRTCSKFQQNFTENGKKLLQHLNEICCSNSTHVTLFSGFMLKLVHVAEYSFKSVETPVLLLLTGTAGCKSKQKIHNTTVCFGDVKNMWNVENNSLFTLKKSEVFLSVSNSQFLPI